VSYTRRENGVKHLFQFVCPSLSLLSLSLSDHAWEEQTQRAAASLSSLCLSLSYYPHASEKEVYEVRTLTACVVILLPRKDATTQPHCSLYADRGKRRRA